MVSGLSLKQLFDLGLRSFETFLMLAFCGCYGWKYKQVVPNPWLQSHLLFTLMKQIQTVFSCMLPTGREKVS